MEASCQDNNKQKTSLWSIDSGYFFPIRDDMVEKAEDRDSWHNDEL